MRDGGTYTTITLGGDATVGGMLDMTERGVPDEIPAHWLVYFAVEDTDATVARPSEPAASVMRRPDRHPGRPLRGPHRPARRRLRRDRAERAESGERASLRRVAEVGGRFGRVAGLALVLPFGGLAEAGALDHLEAEHRALHPRRRDLDPEQLEDELLRQPQQLLAALADQLVGQQRGRRGRDRAALALEGDLGHPALVVEPDRHVLLVAAERVGVLELEVGLLERPKLCGRL